MTSRYVTLKSSRTEIVLDVGIGSRPKILYWGDTLTNTTPDELSELSIRQWARGGAAVDISPSLSNELGAGVPGPAGFTAHRSGYDWAAIFHVSHVERPNVNSVIIVCQDVNTAILATYNITLDPDTHILSASTSIKNTGDSKLSVHWCTSLCLPIDQSFNRLLGFSGRWGDEFRQQEIERFRGSYVRENKRGRTSHESFPGLIAMAKNTDEHNGKAVGFHLGWSGNNIVRADRHSDGSAFAQLGEYILPGEMELAPGDTYATPVLYASWSKHGLNGVSQQFHHHLSTKVMDGRVQQKPRPVHYNTWEAVYFDHSEENLIALAEKAADVGAERYILDDGWFGSRRHDRSGLGDWYVAKDVYPNGLGPLANAVRSLGMEFGIWFEPEMVNPDSDLYRAHPDWVLQANGVEQVPYRGQYALDLTREEVSEYLFERMSSIVAEYDVTYVKWDMNRDIYHPGSAGRAAMHRQTHALYTLINRLRDHFPNLEIESCSAGGGRADFGILQYTHRFWTSDNTDALDRQSIQKGASYFFPPNIMGAHVSPFYSLITGRKLSMAFRAGAAFFGHFGIEANLFEEEERDLAILKEAIALHKQHRSLMHSGTFSRLETEDYLCATGIVSDDKSEGVFSCVKQAQHDTTLPGRLRLAGLNPSTKYRVRLIWPTGKISVTEPSIIDRSDLSGTGAVFHGEALMTHGIQLPTMYPETCLIYHLSSE